MAADPREDALDQASADSFPSSDPPSHTATTRAGAAEDKRRDQARDVDAGAAGEAIPKGTPTSHRHEHETTAPRLDSSHPPERDER